MASKSAYRSSEAGAEIEELLEALEKAVDRLRSMFEQYFLGISRVPPSHLHTDAERKLRELAQIQIRNTALRYRFATLQQKFGSYNNYWRRTLREIEKGTYRRSLSKLSRKAAAQGAEIPEEILAAMPKRMREQVARDRENAAAMGKRRGQVSPTATGGLKLEELDLTDDVNEETLDVAEITSPIPKQDADVEYASYGKVHRIEASEVDTLDLEQLLDDLVAPDVRRRASDSIASLRAPPRAGTAPGVGDGRTPAPGPVAAPPAARPAAPRGPHTVPAARVAQKMPRIPAPAPATTPPPPGRASDPAAATRRISPAALGRKPPAPGGPPPDARTTVLGRKPAANDPALDARTTPIPRQPASPPRPGALPPGMTEGDVRTLYQKFARAREMVGERNDDSTYQTLLRTLHQQAPKIMAQYKAKSVEFGVVIKDKQVVLKARPK